MSAGTSLRGHLIAGMALLLLLALLLAVVGATTLSRANESTSLLLEESVEGGRLASALTIAVTDQGGVVERALDDANPALNERWRRLADSIRQLTGMITALPGLSTEEQAILRDVTGRQDRLEQARVAALGRNSGGAEPSDATTHAQVDALRGDVAALITARETRIAGRVQAFQAASERRRTMLWGLFFLALATGMGSAWYTIRTVNMPLARLIAATRRFGGGDLRAADLGGMPAELAALGAAMNAMGSRLRQLMISVGGEAREITSDAADFSALSQELAATSGQISEAMVQLTEAAGGQVRALRETDSHLGRLQETGLSTLRAAQRVTAIGHGITAVAEDHRTQVQTASATLLALRETVHDTAAEVREASRRAELLTSLVERDRQLATKVGVLAVNTSIEAARAGEHGHGIRAVAEELRLLGELCETTADQGELAVQALQEQVQATAARLDQGSTTVLGVEGVAARAAAALTEIARGIDQVNQAAEQVVRDASAARTGITAMLDRTAAVARAATEHASTGESVAAAAEEQAAATEEMASAAARLSGAARRLTDLLREFRS